ncbi:gamma-glutamyltransferase [Embleya sp. NPDC127516]|uniref:gamma-glutamyltransferase n=1 Tax=Embleya sp. NPDC127516 TaxID=3363990 RepID=UPI00382B3314
MVDFSAATDAVVQHEDRLDIPILVRGGPARRPTPQWQTARTPWPALGAVPPHGWYLATTTWREILKQAAGVGRDVTPWLVHLPQLALQELLARISPLQAYLTLEDTPAGGPYPHNAGRRLVPSVVHTHGAERSARGAFGYRLGMTMAQWLCCGLMGLPSTTDVESRAPAGLPGFDDPKKRLPDLWGRHPGDMSSPWWLIEAKAGFRIGKPELMGGREQLLSASALMAGHPHRLLLTGTSIADQVFMTLDEITVPPPLEGGGGGSPLDPGPTSGDDASEDDDVLLEAALDQLLVYLHLRYGPQAGVRVTPLASGSASARREAGGGVVLLEHDVETRETRRALRGQWPADHRGLRERPGVVDFISAPIPGTGVHLGMSRSLFAACASLHRGQMRIVRDTPGLLTSGRGLHHLLFETDDDLEAVRREQRGRFRERETREHDRIRRDVREGYVRGADSDWAELLGGAEPRVSLGENLLEAAGPETYVAVERDEPMLAASRRR